jgi:phosphorylcholine metabolism protein LicD
MKGQNDNLDELQLQKLKMFHTDAPLAEYEKVQRIAGNSTYSLSGYVGTPVNTILRPSQMIWRSEDFAVSQTVYFEGIPMRIPMGYENILHATYGDYMQFPPKDKRGVWHSGVIWNPDKPYFNYKDEL